jgi:DNA-binding Lrp family transcriptional regulator
LHLDDVDRRIVASLVEDARASYRAIGDTVGLSAPAVKRRVDRLLDEGAIERFSAVVPPAALGWTVGAVIELFAVGPTAPARIRTALTKHPEVVEAYTVTGEADAIIHVRVRDTDHLEHVLERIRSEDFVSQTRSVVVLSRLIDRPLAVPPERA